MKRFFKTPAGLAIFAFWSLGLAAHAQLNTNTRFAELNQHDIRDVAVQTPYTPYGDKTELNRYGDDGSALIVEATGVIVWRTSDGVYRTIPNSIYAKPMFVSNAECVLWNNAYDPNGITDPTAGTVSKNIVIAYWQLASSSGQMQPLTVPAYGNKCLDTPRITTTTTPYTLVTTISNELPPANATTGVLLDPNGAPYNLYVYRLTHAVPTPQLLSATRWFENPHGTNYLDETESLAVSADGSQVVRLTSYDDSQGSGGTNTPDPGADGNMMLWIRNNGSVRILFTASDPFVVAWLAADATHTFSGGIFSGYHAGGQAGPWPIIRPVEVSESRFVFGLARYDLNVAATPAVLYNYSRDAVADNVQVQPTIALPFPVTVPVSTGEVIALPNFSQKGVVPVFVTQDATGNLSVFKLVGNIATHLYKAKIPLALGMDVAVTRINANPGFESIALRDATNQGIIWLHNGPGRNLVTGAPGATTNFTLINELWGRALFVTPGEVVVWTNALAALQLDGSLQPVSIKHYGRNAVTGAITGNEVQVMADASVQNFTSPGAVRGTQVFAPFPFTQASELWQIETGEKTTGNNSLRLRRYQLLNPESVDEDGEGIRSGLEVGPFYVIPGTFTYSEAVSDAARRGGHLASIADLAEYTRMQTAIKLWQSNSPVPLEKRTIPYPLWIGLELNPAWQWADATPPAFIAGNWVPGEPAAVPGRTSGRLTSAQKWEASNPSNPGGYLLELTPTDPNSKDTDADGASDYDEMFRLITDPVVSNFFSPAAPVAVTSAVSGNYEGFLTALGQGPTASFTLSVTSKGGFTGSINGVPGSAKIRGTFDSATGAVTSIPVKFLISNLSATLSMWVAPDPVTGVYRVSGRMTGLNGDPLIFELRRAAYSKTFPSPDAGSYAITIPAADFPKEGQPNGDGYLTGTIGADGRSRLRGRTSDGVDMSWSGNQMEGNFLSFFAMLNKNMGFVGSNLFVRDSAEVSTLNELAGNWHLVGQADIDGNLMVMRKPITQGAYQIAGYEFHSGAYGSIYRSVSYDQLGSFDQFTVQPNNVVMKFIDGIFSGQDVIANWATNNKITIPKTQTRTLAASVSGQTGELRGTYHFNDPNYSYAQSTGVLGGVVLQKSGEVRGFYKGGTTSGQVVLLPNVDGTQAPVTLISPRDKENIPFLGMTYKIYVTASEPWTIVGGVPWVSITPNTGTGNAVLVVTVGKNGSNVRRTVDLTIAGIKHHIAQSFNPRGGSNVTITPSVRSVNHLGTDGSVWSIAPYTVTVTGLVNGSAADFSSSVDWVVVTPNANFTAATVMVMPWMVWTYSYSPRTAEVIIGGATHTVIQSSRYYDYYYYWWSY